ncbi:hypothetical protein [Trinickia sp.]|uniref:hypothetical protein n=1 Tax=Trinickia sp. TaxID=2571163 RepID=UPI003F7E8540
MERLRINKTALAFALFTTAASIFIAVLSGGERGGTHAEQAVSIALSMVAVLFVHLAPTMLPRLGWAARMAAIVLWFVGLVVVAYGQVAFILRAQEHAGNVRALAVPNEPMQTVVAMPGVRNPLQIAQDVSKVRLALARVDAEACFDSCVQLKARKASLSAKLAVLNVEASEATRREVAADLAAEQLERGNALRDRMRSDPVVSHLAKSLGATESVLSLSFAVAMAIVLEGAAIMSWLVVGSASGRQEGYASRVDALPDVAGSAGNATDIAPAAGIERLLAMDTTNAGGSLSDDEREIVRIHSAVSTGRLSPTQKAIRKFLGCGQQRAGHLNRVYAERFGRLDTEVA